MRFKLIQPVYIMWRCPSNTMIDNSIATAFQQFVGTFESNIIPQIGEHIIFVTKEKTYKVQSIERIIYNTHEDFTIFVEDEIIKVDYYDYMKTFTHCCDYMKSDDDPTKDLSRSHETAIFPTELQEWKEQIQKLKSLK